MVSHLPPEIVAWTTVVLEPVAEYKGAPPHVKTLLASSTESGGRALSQEPRLRVHRLGSRHRSAPHVRSVGAHDARLHRVGEVRAKNLLAKDADEAWIR